MRLSEKPLSIVHVTDSFYPEAGGVERVVENLALCQLKKGHKVSVLCKETGKSPDKEDYKGIKVYRYHRKNRPTPINYASSYLGSAKLFGELAASSKIDIVHCHLTLSSQGPMKIANEKTIPLIASFYGPWDKEFLAETELLLSQSSFMYGAYLKLQMKMQKWLQKRLLNQARRVVVLSDYSITQARRIQPDVNNKLVKIPGGVETDRFFPDSKPHGLQTAFGFSKETFLVLTFRRLVHRMGVDILIKGVKICLDKGYDITLVIGGNGPLRSSLEEMTFRLNVNNNVFFAGFIPDSKLPDSYREAGLFVLPTRTEENFGLPILESAACATPVIGTPVGSIREVLGQFDKRLICENVTPEGISEKIIEIYNDKENITKLFKTISKKVQNDFSWDIISYKMEKLYQGVIT